MSDIVKQEVRHYWSLKEIISESEEMFDKLAEVHCNDFSATKGALGEHINKCKNSGHPFHFHSHTKTECLVHLCPLRK